MTNKEKYRQAFGVLHASGKIDLEADMKNNVRIYSKRAVILCVCAVLLLGLGMTAYAGRRISGWAGNSTIEQSSDPKGGVISTTTLHTDDLTEPVEIDGDKMYFVVNDERIDITERVTGGGFFDYVYKDNEGCTHYWLVGLNRGALNSYGYAEFIADESGQWIGGYAARTDSDLNPEWLAAGKQKYKIPW